MPRIVFGALVLLLVISGGFQISLAQLEFSAEELLGEGLHQEEVEEDYEAAIRSYRAVLESPDLVPSIAARALYHIGGCLIQLGRIAEAQKAYESLLRDYRDQAYYSVQAQSNLDLLTKKTFETARSSVFTIRKVLPAIEYSAVFPPSPDGRYLAYAAANPRDLVIEELATGTIRRLTKAQGALEGIMGILWSKDSKYILLTWLTSQLVLENRVIRITDGWTRTINIDKQIFAWDWEPNKTSILAVMFETPELFQLTRISMIDGSSTVLRAFPGNIYPPDFMKISSDGRFIAFNCAEPDSNNADDIYVWRLSDNEIIPVTTYVSNDELIDWTPDGRSLLFLSDREGTVGLWRIPVADGKPTGDAQLIKSDSGITNQLGITQTGTLYYGSTHYQTEVFLTSLNLETGQVLEKPKPINPYHLGTNADPIWSTDGKSLAYFCGSRDSITSPRMPVPGPPICVYSLEDGTYQQLSMDESRGLLWNLDAWLPGRDEIIVRTESAVMRINTESGQVLAQYDAGASWVMLPDGRTAIFPSSDPETRVISYTKHDLITGSESQIYKGNPSTSTLVAPVPSPDGKWLAFTHRLQDKGTDIGHVLIAVSLLNGEVRQLLHLPPDQSIISISWSHNGSDIFYTIKDESDSSIRRLWIIPLAGGKPSRTDLTSRAMHGIAVHPDGKTLAFTSSWRNSTGIWAIDNFMSTSPENKDSQ